MFDKMKGFAKKTRDAISKTAVLVGDLNGDGKVDEEDARIAAEWAKKTAASVGDEAGKLGKMAMQSDLAKDAATGAGIGAVVAIPVPVIGPMAGAAIGAGIGVYKNLTKPNQPTPGMIERTTPPRDGYAALLKLDELRQKNIISEAEFEEQKKRILAANT
ncbi:MAG: SHOCT domain-containing protein [Deferrisomatales bacterium]|nr:SHOCT domain-containing protein [Deferrisomatales bacterium]